MSNLKVEQKYKDNLLNVALDTLKNKKQALVFVNTKRSAEKTSEDISKKLKIETKELTELAEKILNVLSKPTKQCKRLAKIIEKGIAFHHAGLHTKQRELIEDAFRDKKIKIICATPTLCVSKDTKIWHGISETKISAFKRHNPLFVLSKNKLINMKSQKIQKIHNSSNLIQISSASNHTIKVTPNHKMLIKRKNKKIIIKAENIKKSDKIATIGKLNIIHESIPSFTKFTNNKQNINFKFTPDLSYFIGLMLGDGYSGAETNNNKIKYKGTPSIVGIDSEVFSHVEKICKKLKLNCRKIKNFYGTPQLLLGKNNWFREFLVWCGVEHREKKHISEKLMILNLENISSLLKGLFDTDGFVNKQKNVGFSNISEKLIKQMQKLLLRFGIVTYIRKRKASSIKIHEKEYKTKPHFELLITQKKNIFDFYRFIGFNIKRKQNDLINLVSKLCSNLNYVSCNKCNYKIYANLFSGRTATNKKWGNIKLKTIILLGEKGELGSRELKKLLNQEAKKNERRLNHHYELIKKRKIGNKSNTEWFWSLNPIGKWIFENILNKKKQIIEFFKFRKCPVCQNNLNWIIKKGWRDSDFEGDIFWDIIREIKQVNTEEFVYDIILPNKPKNNHLFVANGFIIHNSAGIDLPAFRSIIRDVKRFTNRGMRNIPVLEYLQMAGRCGRPSFDSFGESILIASSETEKDKLFEHYICGEPEDIYSKLAVEPVLRTYLLSLISTKVIQSIKEILNFFGKTFWAFQFKDMDKLELNITKMLDLLTKWKFIDVTEDKYRATLLGKRIAELYIDPLTANHFIDCINQSEKTTLKSFSFLQMVCNTLEMRPLLRVRVKEYDEIQDLAANYEQYLLDKEPSMFDPEYDTYLDSIKTATMLNDWIDEKDEEFILEKFNSRPGELHAKVKNANWLLYALYEISRIQEKQPILKEITKIRLRLKYGAKEELLKLLKLENIGRIRARKLFKAGIKDLKDIKNTSQEDLTKILGKGTALKVLMQSGVSLNEKNNNQGQLRNFL